MRSPRERRTDADGVESGGFAPRELARRGVRALVTLLGITLATFLVLQLLPGDPAALPPDGEAFPVPPEVYRAMRHRMGLDRPLPVQYFAWVRGVLHGDLGESFADGRPVTARLAERLPGSVLLQGLSLLLVLAIAVPLGVSMARRSGSTWDRAGALLLFLLFAIPGFWVAVLLQELLAVRLGWLPLEGTLSVGMERAPIGARLLDLVGHLALPVFSLVLGQIAFLARFTRASVLEVLGKEFVQAARARGLPERLVLRRHALRNALVPLLTLTGLLVPSLLGGSVLIESIFSWPGLGSLFWNSVSRRDYPVVMALVLLSAMLTLLANLAADLLYRAADPRAAGSAG